MKVLGLTGGIGMGKSAAAKHLKSRGYPVVDTDVLARKLVEPGQSALHDIQQAFGPEILDDSGWLRRNELARRVFSDSTARQRLEAILHPCIRDLWKQQLKDWHGERKTLAVVVIPLLFETDAVSEFDATVCVACSRLTQQQRLLHRGWTDEQIAQRINAQWPVDRKIAGADYVVWTEGAMEKMAEQMERVVREILDVEPA